MQTRENAENVAFNMQGFGSEVIRDSMDKINRQKSSQKISRNQNQKSERQRYQGADRDRNRNKQSKSLTGKIRIANKTKGSRQKSKTKGCLITESQ